MGQTFVNVIIPFAATRAEVVKRGVMRLVDVRHGNRPIPRVRKALIDMDIVHFMSITVVGPGCPDDPPDKERRKPAPIASDAIAHLMIEMSVDGGARLALESLAATLPAEMAAVLQDAGVRVKERLADFLWRHHKVIGAGWFAQALGQVHAGTPGRSARRICQENELAEAVGNIVLNASPKTWRNLTPRQRLDDVRVKLWAESTKGTDYKWAFVPEPAPLLAAGPDDTYAITNPVFRKVVLEVFVRFLWPFVVVLLVLVLLAFAAGDLCKLGGHWLPTVCDSWHVALMWLGFLLTVAVAVLFAALLRGYRLLRRAEESDAVVDMTPDRRRVQRLMDVENLTAQNHLASVSRLKPGWLRTLSLHLAFIVVGTGRLICQPGFLGKNGVIHFGRWMRIPGTDQLLFWSNYDGTWSSYVADFIADAPSGVTGIWSNCVGFPRSENLFGRGATDRDRLVRWARRQQHPTIFWFSRYPHLTTTQIRRNAAIRQGIASAESDADARDWLSLFGSAPRPASNLIDNEIPTLVYGGLSDFVCAECWMFQFPGRVDSENIAKAKSWLAQVAPMATFGEQPSLRRDYALVVGFSARGLAHLGVPPASLKTFAVPFQQGMWDLDRARMLGDNCEQAPRNWRWGSPPNDAHVVAIVYAVSETRLQSLGELLETCFNDVFPGHHSMDHQRFVDLGPKLMPTTCRGEYPNVAGAPAAGDDCCPVDQDDPENPRVKYKRGSRPREWFGFVDGVSQPIIQGTYRAIRHPDPLHLIQPGEMVLGYPDNVGRIPPAVRIAARYDPLHMLPDAGSNLQRRRPEFGCYEGDGDRDLGANGTFLVIRQLEQNTDAFDGFLNQYACESITTDLTTNSPSDAVALYPWIGNAHDPNYPRKTTLSVGYPEASPVSRLRSTDSDAAGIHGTPTRISPIPFPLPVIITNLLELLEEPVVMQLKNLAKELLAAKLVGRWRSTGSSLVRHPYESGASMEPREPPDNEFLYGIEDPTATRCPFGAHVRRANPRDTRFPGSMEEIATNNRHRILRVGRKYDNTLPAQGQVDREGGLEEQRKDRGLFFMCVNADIERQFEFVQTTWLLNPGFDGLDDEVDPILGRKRVDEDGVEHKKCMTIVTPGGPLRFEDVPDFVKMIGGGYFFLPGRTALGFLASKQPSPYPKSWPAGDGSLVDPSVGTDADDAYKTLDSDPNF